MLNFFRIPNFKPKESSSQICYLIFSSFLLTYRFFLTFLTFNWLSGVLLMAIFIQIIILIFIKPLKKLKFLRENEMFINIFSLLIHKVTIYFNHDRDWQFFLGMELIILIYLNFQKIKNQFFRKFFLATTLMLFATKNNNFEFNVAEFFYSLCYITMFECTLLGKKKSNFFSSYSIPSLPSLKLKSFQKTQDISKIRKECSTSNQITSKFDKELLNSLGLGLIIVNENYDIVFSNGILSQISKYEDQEEGKNFFFSLRENIDLKKSDFWKISDLNIKKRFKYALQIQEMYKNGEVDEVSEKSELKKMFSYDDAFITLFPTENEYEQEDLTSTFNFKQWKKKSLSKNLKDTPSFFEFREAKPNSYSVKEYLEKLFDSCKDETDSHFRNPPYNDKEEKKFSMYVECKKTEEKFSKILINFIPLENRNSASGVEILVVIRELNEIERKYYDDLIFKHQILSSFCLELRTPINGIISMLDLMQMHIEEMGSMAEELADDNFDDLVTNAVISSNLLLNQIDDFIDYFSYRNEIIETHPGPFDFKEAFQEIYRIFSYISSKKDLRLIIQIDERIPSIVYNDYRRLKQIMFNLLNNAIKFTNNSGFIKIVAVLKKSEFIQISVLDSGHGIKQVDFDSLGKISLADNNEDSKKSTCGMGLFICNILFLLVEEGKNIDKPKKGLIVYSEHGFGTCFTFRFRCDIDSNNNDFNENKGSKLSFNEKKNLNNLSSLISLSLNTTKKNQSLIFHEKSMNRTKTLKTNDIKNTTNFSQESKSTKLKNSHNFDEISYRSVMSKKNEFEKKRNRKKFIKKDSKLSNGNHWELTEKSRDTNVKERIRKG